MEDWEEVEVEEVDANAVAGTAKNGRVVDSPPSFLLVEEESDERRERRQLRKLGCWCNCSFFAFLLVETTSDG